jgi:hypothetical protein
LTDEVETDEVEKVSGWFGAVLFAMEGNAAVDFLPHNLLEIRSSYTDSRTA